MLVAGTFGCSPAGPAPEAAAATEAAEVWLAGVDTGKYSQSWQHGSEWLRVQVPEQRWAEALSAVRTESGALRARELHAARLTDLNRDVLHAGDFAVVQYASGFAHVDGVETLVLRQEQGRWRVAGYRLDPRMPWE